MAQTTLHHVRAIGEKLREIRQEHKMSLRELAGKSNISASMLSQIETGKVSPSVRSLYDIAAALGVPVDYFFPDQKGTSEDVSTIASTGGLTASEMRSASLSGDPVLAPPSQSPTPVIHAEERPTIELNGGVTWSRLTTLAEKDAEFLEINYEPGAASGANMSHHGGREFGYVLEGELIIELGFESHVLKQGDSIVFESETPHRLINKGTVPMRAVWVVLNQH